MMHLEAGNVYTARMVRNGTSQRGAWEMITVSDKKQNNDITIFPRNIPTGIVEGSQFKLEEICSLKNGMRQTKEGKWLHNVTCEAIVSKIESEFDTGLAGQGGINWDEMAAAGDDPWADIAELPV